MKREIYTVPQAAAELGRSPELVRSWLRDETIRGEKIGEGKGGVWTISARELERFRKVSSDRRRAFGWVSQGRTAPLFHATTFGSDNRPSMTMLCGIRLDTKRSRTWAVSGMPANRCTRCDRKVAELAP